MSVRKAIFIFKYVEFTVEFSIFSPSCSIRPPTNSILNSIYGFVAEKSTMIIMIKSLNALHFLFIFANYNKVIIFSLVLKFKLFDKVLLFGEKGKPKPLYKSQHKIMMNPRASRAPNIWFATSLGDEQVGMREGGK